MAKEDLVQAKYLGDTPVVMPDLVDRERPDKADEIAAWEEGGRQGINPACYVVKGDVVLLDEASAEGRVDFEVVAAKRSTKKES